jgi:thaumarchaeosortase
MNKPKMPMKITREYLHRLKGEVIKHLPLLLFVISVIIPFILLYDFDPDSFSRTWKGRTFYLFFVWLIFLEGYLDWETIRESKLVLKSRRFIFFIITASLPTLYVVAERSLGLYDVLYNMVDWLGIPFIPDTARAYIIASTPSQWILSIEHIVLTALFALLFWTTFRKKGLTIFSVSLFMTGTIGAIYMIDTVYPYGYFTPLQSFVPFTASMAASVLNWIGYQTAFIGQQLQVPILQVSDSAGHILVRYGIGWPCAGVQSLLIYTFVLLIFFKKTTIPLLHRVIYFAVGALITYCVNILRIVAIYLIYINNLSQGVAAAQQAAGTFHDFYGGLMSMTWIMIYPLIIIGSRILWNRFKKPKSIHLNKNIQAESHDAPVPVDSGKTEDASI